MQPAGVDELVAGARQRDRVHAVAESGQLDRDDHRKVAPKLAPTLARARRHQREGRAEHDVDGHEDEKECGSAGDQCV